ncbi:MAG: hypothetical protein AAF804_03435, partial [Bacteroidota bacterium]
MNHLSLLLLCLFSALSSMLWAQSGYEGAWSAGLIGMNQNPASLAAATSKRELLLGAIYVGASTDAIFSNHLGSVMPARGLRSVLNPAWDLPFFTLSPESLDQTNISSRPTAELRMDTRIQGPAYRTRLNTGPNLIERGLQRQAFSVRTVRREQLWVRGLPVEWWRYQRSGQLLDQNFTLNAHSFARYEEWDALALNYAQSWGRGQMLLHWSIGGELRSMGAFFQASLNQASLQAADGWVDLSFTGLQIAHNPSFERSLDEEQRRRFRYFEHSWGVAGELGLLLQALDYDRKPKWEIGLAAFDFGARQIWNLSHHALDLEAGVLPTQAVEAAFEDPSDWVTLLHAAGADTIQLEAGIQENYPLRLVAHAKTRLGRSPWAVQLRADYQNFQPVLGRGLWLNGMLSYEGRNLGIFIPVASQLDSDGRLWPSSLPQVGLYLHLKDVFV